jgi:tetratricopeptide (TPR) repeat protein
MPEPQENPYKVLGVERTADERAIKKAYFGLIRKFTPEAAPDEFQKIRAAYELLSDPAARARFDDQEKGYGEYGDEVAERLQQIDQAIEQGNDELAVTMLRALLANDPGLAVARQSLAFAHMRAERYDEALHEWTNLVARDPDNARYRMQRAITKARLGKPVDAELDLRDAHRRDPNDAGIRLNLVECLFDQDKHDEAVRLLDEGLALLDEKSPPALLMALRKLEALAIAGHPIETEVARLEARVAAIGEPDLPRYVANQLGAVAAKLFVRARPIEGNAILEICRRFHPEGSVERALPAVIKTRLRDLPEAAQAWLAECAPGDRSPTIAEAIWTGPFFAILSCGALIVAATALVLDALSKGREAMLPFLVCAAAAVATVFTARKVVRILASPLRAFTTVHPLFLVRARGDRVELYPLLQCTEARGIHHHTNGVYSGTQLTFRFGTASLGVRIQGQDYAQAWMNHVNETRKRTVMLLAEGYLEAEQGVDTLSPAAVAKLVEAPSSKRGLGDLALVGGALLAAAIVAGSASLLGERANERRAFSEAQAKGSIADFARYLERHPNGAHAAAARAAVTAAIDAAAKHAASDGETLKALLDWGATARPPRLAVVVEGDGTSLDDESRVVTALEAALSANGLDGAVSLGAEPASADATITLALEPREALPRFARDGTPVALQRRAVTVRIARAGATLAERSIEPTETSGESGGAAASERALSLGTAAAAKAIGLGDASLPPVPSVRARERATPLYTTARGGRTVGGGR